MNFKIRSSQKELLDEQGIPFMAIAQNMLELNTINTLLGGHAITLTGFKKLLRNKTKITVCEIGCGGGDNLAAIVKYCNKKKLNIYCIGIDSNSNCLATAEQNKYLQNNTRFICSDYAQVIFDIKPDIIFSSLFCHHFIEEELSFQLKWMMQNSSIGFFINDLHRHRLAYYSIQFLTQLFSKSYLVKNDAPLSVARGFKKAEWNALFSKAEIKNYKIYWKWAFRHLVIKEN